MRRIEMVNPKAKDSPLMQFQMKIDPMTESTAVLDIFDDICEYTDFDDKVHGFGARTVATFLAENPSVQTIKVRINSNGGDVFEGIAVHNLLKSSGKEVIVEVVGLAASIASVIAMAGEKVVMHPTSQMMIHNCWTFACGNADDLRALADQMDKIMASSRIAYLKKAGSKLTCEKLIELLDAESWLTAEECLEFGLCDEITESTPKPAETKKEEKPQEKAPEKPAQKVRESLWF